MARIAYWGPYSGHVGTIKAQINSAWAMHRFGGHDTVLIRAHSEFEGLDADLSKKGIRVADLGLSRRLKGLQRSAAFARRPYMLACALLGFLPLKRFLESERPDVLICSLISAPAVLAADGLKHRPSIVISIQGYPRFLGLPAGQQLARWKRVEEWTRQRLWSAVYRKADRIVCLTEQTRERLHNRLALKPEKLAVVPNPIIDDDMLRKAREPVTHPWFSDHSMPLVCAVGRLTVQKDFETLLRAFAKVIARRPARLVILGEGEERAHLEALVSQLKLGETVQLLGFQGNPFAYLSRSDLFVLSSVWEDPGHAIIEAAALDVPIVTTDCPNGPSELVSHGRGGRICRTGDVDDMAAKILDALDHPDPSRKAVAFENSQRFTLQSHYAALSKVLELKNET